MDSYSNLEVNFTRNVINIVAAVLDSTHSMSQLEIQDEVQF